ncbi:MAG: hypothetical protein ABIH82_05850 [Candidatus Woesearchaeota archaeon]
MIVNFFEEFPTKTNLNKINLITWPSTIYVAAKSFKDFNKITQPYKKKNITFAYWPILEHKEGYWLSPFSSSKAVKRITKEIYESKDKNIKIMWDAELPFRHPWLFLRIDNFLKNKIIIKTFFKQNGKNILTSEYPVKNKLAEVIFKFLGIYFSPKKFHNKKIIMYYTSMHHLVSKLFLKNIARSYQKYEDDLQVGLGTIAHGILGDEPILKPQLLNHDLKDMQKIGIKEVVIFRLGGLNKEYVQILNRYITK